MAAVFETEKPISAIHIDGLAVLKIVKHCQESLPKFVSGSLLGIEADGVLEITHSFPFPEPRDSSKSSDGLKQDESDVSALDGHEYQLEMMKMLREVNVDNNCVGWYQSMYLGSYSTPTLLENQLAYQTDLSANAVVLLYDPMQTAHGNLELKCLKLTKEAVKHKESDSNAFLESGKIFEEVPITMRNPALVKALLHNVKTGQYNADIDESPSTGVVKNAVSGGNVTSDDVSPVYGTDTTLDRLDLSTNPYLEKHLEFLSNWVDDLAAEQGKFQYYMRSVSRGGYDKRGDKKRKEKVPAKEAWASSDAPRRIDSLLISNQIRSYCEQVDKFTDSGFGKLFVVDGLQKK